MVLVFQCLVAMVREFSDSRLSKHSTGYYVFSMRCTYKDELLVHFRAIIHGSSLQSVYADFIASEMSLAQYCDENRRFLSAVQRYIMSGMSSVLEDEALERRLAF